MESLVISEEQFLQEEVLHGKEEKENKKKGMIISLIIHCLLLILLILPFMKFPFPPPGQEGILVSFGMPKVGEGDDNPDAQQEEIAEVTPPSETTPTPEKVEPEVKPTPPAAAQPVESQPQEVLTTKNADIELAAQKKKAEERQQQLEAERKLQQERDRLLKEAEAKRQAEAAAAAAAAAKQKRKQEAYEQSKKQYGDLLGSGKGNTGKAGNQGDPGGDPNASNLEGISKGSGMIGGGLSNRGVKSEPEISDKSQKTGIVVVKVCVDENGNVISANYTQLGSSTNDGELKALAIQSAKKFKFVRSGVDKQCGTITIDFKLK